MRALRSGFSISLLPSISSSLATTLPSLVQPSLRKEGRRRRVVYDWPGGHQLSWLRLELCSRVDVRVHVYTLRTIGRDKNPTGSRQTRESLTATDATVLTASPSPPSYTLCVVANQVSPCWELDSHLISCLHLDQKCVKLFGDFCGTRNKFQVQMEKKSDRNSPDKLFN